MGEEHKESLESPAKPRQIQPDPAKSCQIQQAADASEPSASEEPTLTPPQELAILALVTARSVAAAARQSGVGERSIHRWLHEDKPFQARLRQLRNEALGQASSRLQQGAADAVGTMYELIESGRPVESGRAALIRTALDFAFRSGAYSDLAERIADLEKAAPEEKK